MKKILYFTSLCFILFTLNGCATATKSLSEKYKDKTAAELYNNGELAVAKGRYKDAIDYFEGLQSVYPFNDYAEQSQLSLIYAYYKSDDQVSAVAAADRFLRFYPRSQFADYALYLRGLANFEQKRGLLQNIFYVDIASRDFGTMTQAFSDFRLLLERFPNSKYAPDAHKRMIYLRDMFAKHELDVAKFYMRQKNYVAASNRATYIVQHLQGASEVKAALIILVKANSALGLSKPAEDAKRILELNYPSADNNLPQKTAKKAWYHVW